MLAIKNLTASIIRWPLVIIFNIFAVGLSPCVSLAQVDPDANKDKSAIAAVRDEIWANEQAIYAGRGRGDLGPYIAHTSKNYVAWPPNVAAPMDYAKLVAGLGFGKTAKERLTMTLRDFALSGDTAVIYYQTHVTARSDGTPVDQTFEVTHTWVREDGVWRVIGGMARLAPDQSR